MEQENLEQELLKKIDSKCMPVHLAIIMDGNGRWAKARGLPRSAGHRQGVETLREIVRYSRHLGIKVLTLFAFSTENWKRPTWEVNFLMSLPEKYLHSELPELIKNKVRINLIGDAKKLPKQVRQVLDQGVGATRQNDGMLLNFALNYGSRMEIINAVQAFVDDVVQGKAARMITEEIFASYLYTADIPDPDLLIRTSGEYRISNFLLWQLAYSELWITEVNWPDFTRTHLLQAIYDFQQRERRFGKV